MDATIVSHTDALKIGIAANIPHPKVTMINIMLVFWTVIIVFGAEIGRDGK